MRILLTNDDGIDAPGIAALERAIASTVRDIFIVAPQSQMSECGHRFTLREPIAVEPRRENAYAVAGTPADCSRLGLTELTQNIDWVLSGVNAGGNLGVDIYTSGTVAAAREAAILGKPAIAFSHYIQRPQPIDWELVSYWTTKIWQMLLSYPLKEKHFWNVNFPHLTDSSMPEVNFCPRSTDPMSIAYQPKGVGYQYAGAYPERQRSKGTDVDICFSGNIAITQIPL